MKACPPTIPMIGCIRRKGTGMIVIGIDPHMKTHTAVAVDAATGASLGEKTVSCDRIGHDALLSWARGLSARRSFAVEDCRHVSGRLERRLLSHGEHVVRVPPKMMAGARSAARTYGKSDPIDAASVARAALREPGLPEASLTGPEHDVRLLVDHRGDLVDERKRIQNRVRWNCHDLEIGLDLPPRVLDRYVWLDRLESVLGAVPESTRRRIALDQLRRCRDLTTEIRSLEREIRTHMRELAPDLLSIPGCSAISAAHLIGQTAGASRFSGEAAFAMHVGTAPLRQPPPQLDHPHDRRHPGSDAPSGDRLHGTQTGRGDELPRGAPLSEAIRGESGVQDDAKGGT
jgi:transposase